MRRRPRLDSTGVLLSLFYITAGERTTIFRLAVIINFSVDVQPGFLFFRLQVLHDLHQIGNHLLADAPNERRTFWRDAYHHLSSIISGNGANNHAEIL